MSNYVKVFKDGFQITVDETGATFENPLTNFKVFKSFEKLRNETFEMCFSNFEEFTHLELGRGCIVYNGKSVDVAYDIINFFKLDIYKILKKFTRK